MKELKNGFTRNQSNTSTAITHAKTKMTANQLKAFYQTTTLINQQDKTFYDYSISVENFVTKLGFTQTNSDYVKDLCRHLAKQYFEIEQDGIWEIYPIFSMFKFDTKKQLISISFNDKMRPFLLELQEKFTQIKEIKHIIDFESKYTIRIYAMLKDYRLMKFRDFEINKLTEILQLPKSYENYAQLDKKVLQVATAEINQKSDLIITKIEPIEKERKKILKIRVHFKTKEPTAEAKAQTQKANEVNKFKKYIGKAVLYVGNLFQIESYFKTENNQIQFVGSSLFFNPQNKKFEATENKSRLDFHSLDYLESCVKNAKDKMQEMKNDPSKFEVKDHSEAMQNLFAKFAKN